MAVKIERCNEPTGEQLAASAILTGASALRMIRAERRQMGYIGWKDLNPDEERRVLCTSSPSTEDIYLPDLVRIGAKSGEVQEDLCLLVGSAAQRRRMPGVGWSVCSGLPVGSILEVEPISRGPLCCRRPRGRLYPGVCTGPGTVFQDFTKRSREVSASLHLACCE